MARQTVILPDDGFEVGDTNWVMQVPNQTTSGLGVVKDPLAGAWVALTVWGALSRLGYLVVQQDNAAGTRLRIPLADHPDGP
jgi:hypothetical protein